jgi:hypothetical protein
MPNLHNRTNSYAHADILNVDGFLESVYHRDDSHFAPAAVDQNTVRTQRDMTHVPHYDGRVCFLL